MKKIMVLIFGLVLVLTACPPEGEEDHREQDEETQNKVHSKLQEKIPPPQIDGAAARSAVKRHLERWQNEDVVSYVNVFAENGRGIGFYVAQGKVASTCQMLTKPDQRDEDVDGDLLRAAPALDGTYYPESINCGKFFFTADSNAYVAVYDFPMIVTDQPLENDINPLDVNIQGLDNE